MFFSLYPLLKCSYKVLKWTNRAILATFNYAYQYLRLLLSLYFIIIRRLARLQLPLRYSVFNSACVQIIYYIVDMGTKTLSILIVCLCTKIIYYTWNRCINAFGFIFYRLNCKCLHNIISTKSYRYMWKICYIIMYRCRFVLRVSNKKLNENPKKLVIRIWLYIGT